MEKTTVFNLVILDESGSMSSQTEATISGCNETLNVIREEARKNSDKIRSLVSIYAFQDGGEICSRYLVKNQNALEVREITNKDYCPWGNTPLYDAIGSTLSELKAVADTYENATAIVTIMTDGYENSSTMYSYDKVANLIASLREIGWTINLVGADVDVEKMARELNISVDNTMRYNKRDTNRMWERFNRGTMEVYKEEIFLCKCSEEDKIKARKSRKFFND